MWSGQNSRRSRRISRGVAFHRKGERNFRVVPPFPESPDVSVHSRETCFPCTASTFKPRIDSHHGGRWDSPVGKPRGKATDPLNHAKGSVTLLLQLGRKALFNAPTRMKTDSPGETPEVPQDPCQHWRGILRFQDRPTQGLRPRHRRDRNPERPPSISHGDWPFLRPPQRVPEVPVVSRDHLPQLEKIQEILPSRRNEAHFR